MRVLPTVMNVWPNTVPAMLSVNERKRTCSDCGLIKLLLGDKWVLEGSDGWLDWIGLNAALSILSNRHLRSG